MFAKSAHTFNSQPAGCPGGSAGKESACSAGDPGSIPGREDPLEKDRLPTPVFWPREFHGQRSLAGYSPWGCKESDMTEQLSLMKSKAII